METPKQQPAFKGELGPFRYAGWINQTQNGKRHQNVEISRSYKQENEWKEEKVRLRHVDVVALRHLLKEILSKLDAHATDGSSV